MRLTGKNILLKLKKKNIGNQKLCNAIDELILDLETFDPVNDSLAETRKDADCVHGDGFYFFDLHIHRTLIMVELDDEEATIVWAGNHQEYERIFKNNKSTIEKWLRDKDYI